MLTVLGGLAEFEREPIRARTGAWSAIWPQSRSAMIARLRCLRAARLLISIHICKVWTGIDGAIPYRSEKFVHARACVSCRH